MNAAAKSVGASSLENGKLSACSFSASMRDCFGALALEPARAARFALAGFAGVFFVTARFATGRLTGFAGACFEVLAMLKKHSEFASQTGRW
ncbi:MAG: hypothetical protein H0V17_24485 [Deltaproteobacteria bacterium]|nr:hypothetical protein [Deltaproteobacteria bacterium]